MFWQLSAQCSRGYRTFFNIFLCWPRYYVAVCTLKYVVCRKYINNTWTVLVRISCPNLAQIHKILWKLLTFVVKSRYRYSSSRPSPADLFCCAPRFPLTFFVRHTSPRPFLTGSLLFSAANIEYSFVPRDIFLCVYLFDSCAISFHFSTHSLLSNRLLPFIVDLLQTIGSKWSPIVFFCLANVFLCISMRSTGFAYAMPLFFPFKMAFWSRLMKNVPLSRPQGVGVSAIQSWKVILHASRSHQLRRGCKRTTKTPETKHIGMANGNCFLQGNLA